MSKRFHTTAYNRISITLATLLVLGILSLALSACSTSNTSGGLKGLVASVDVAHAAFVLTPLQSATNPTSLTIHISPATQYRGALHRLADLTAGMVVSVQGAANASSGLVASEVEDEPEANDQEHERAGAEGAIQQEAELKGTVGSVDSTQASFVLLFSDGTRKTVTVSAQTEFEGNLHQLSDLTKGERVEVKGTPQADDSFAASSIERGDQDQQDEQNEVELTGRITSVDAAHTSFVLTRADGTLQTVETNAQTEFDGGFQGFADLQSGVQVEVRGNTASGGSLLASRVHREDADQQGGSSSSDGHDSSGSSGGSGSSGSGGDDHSGSDGGGGDSGH
jgi:hypothetical protein